MEKQDKKAYDLLAERLAILVVGTVLFVILDQRLQYGTK